jgi:hypothetical protein
LTEHTHVVPLKWHERQSTKLEEKRRDEKRRERERERERERFISRWEKS